MSTPDHHREVVERAVAQAIGEVNRMRPPADRLSALPGAVLVGDGGLDSLALVNFVVALQGILETDCRLFVPLDEAMALPEDESPFRTIDSVVAYIVAHIVRSAGRSS